MCLSTQLRIGLPPGSGLVEARTFPRGTCSLGIHILSIKHIDRTATVAFLLLACGRVETIG